MQTKACTRCSVDKPLTEFHANKNSKDGRNSQCKSCYFAWRRDYLKTSKGKQLTARRNLHPTMRFIRLKYQAKKRGLDVEITKQQYVELLSRQCHYCGGSVEDTGWGLDRKNNARGYTVDNVVPSCKWCNTVKNDRYSYDEMVLLGKTIREIHDARSSAN